MIESARAATRELAADGTSATTPRDLGTVVAGLAATAFALQTVFAGRFTGLDADARAWVASLAWEHWALVDLRWFASLAPYYGALLVAIGVGVARRRGATAREIVRVATGLGLALVVAQGIKLVCWRTRPMSPIDGLQFDSFPSGHTASIAVCLAAALHLLGLRARGDYRWWYATALMGGATTMAVAFARIYLQRHWLTDVSASLLIAMAFWGTASSARVPRSWLILTVALGFFALTGLHAVLPSPPVPVR